MSEDRVITGIRWCSAHSYSRFAQDNADKMEIAIAREAELQKDGCVSPDELDDAGLELAELSEVCLLYTSPSPRDRQKSRMPSSA